MDTPLARRQFVVLLGCTAVGKSALAVPLAERLDAELLAVDSMQVYRRMDIGTAKPGADDRRRVPHHLIDVAEPSEAFSAARYVAAADAAIADVSSRGRSIVAVAGTPLYLMALLYGLFEGPSADDALRTDLRRRAAEQGSAALHAELARIDPAAAARIHPNDLRRIERALEVHRLTGRTISEMQRQWSGPPRYEFRAIGLRRDREDQAHRINARVRKMVNAGLVDEVRRLLAEPMPMSEQARAALGYAEIIEALERGTPIDDAIEAIKIHTRRFAKSQRTWFRRVPNVCWIDLPPDRESDAFIDAALDALRSC
ncbi:MAG: tRNA (adenosine(37)-N6)-dimethylallyltransferase MiaA [Phycisphaerae bacterium]|nr:tRNA (adenosine(37)-N6)-dimethylallyltransferase MiaA [Phycisphaerae bacterium]